VLHADRVASAPVQPDEALAAIEQRLAALPAVPGLIVSVRTCCLSGVAIDTPTLLLVLRGKKRVRVRGRTATGEPGAYVMVHGAEIVDMEILAGGRGEGRYRAWVIGFPFRVIHLARALLAAHPEAMPPRSGDALSSGPVSALRSALLALLDAAAASPDPAALDHALLGVLLALARAGQGQFLVAAEPSLAARIRLLVEDAPGRSWVSGHFEAELGMSGATLRRRLAEEGTSLRELIREARLHHGLTLLQSTEKPVKAVARESGYRSVASFSRSFSARFGVVASAVGVAGLHA
jgi:AraC-like DNA-binding protein